MLLSQILAFDMHFGQLLANVRTPALNKIFLAITALGSWPVVAAVALVVSYFAWRRGKAIVTAPLWLALAFGELFGFLIKGFFQRVRPAWALYAEVGPAFPSAHATVVVVCYGFLAYLGWRRALGWPEKIGAVVGALILILAVGFSRLYLGVHYTSDVAVGYLLGLAWLVSAIAISRRYVSRLY